MLIMTDHSHIDPTKLMTLLSGFFGRRLLCVGDLMVDRFVYGDVKRISPEAPVPVVRVTHTRSALGGAGNVVRNISALGGAVSFVAIVENDDTAREA